MDPTRRERRRQRRQDEITDAAMAIAGGADGVWKTEVFYANFFTRIGILSAAHIGNLTDLRNAIERGRPLEDGDAVTILALLAGG